MAAESTQRPTPVNDSRDFHSDELFFSTTDAKGIILSGNQVFVRVSAYSLEELIGKPHNIIRHPDMPRIVFKLLWDYIEAGRTIAAYVKNMAKDGRYYWVIAVVSPIRGGYLSIRFKPESSLFPPIQTIYKELLRVEKEIENAGGSQKAAMAASAEELGKILAAHGFSDYDAFMAAFLQQELSGRSWESAANIDAASNPKLAAVFGECEALRSSLDSVFVFVQRLQTLCKTLGDESKFVARVAQAIRLSALNAMIEAERLGRTGAALSVIAGSMARYADEIRDILGEMQTHAEELISVGQQISVRISVSKAQLEMVRFFGKELLGRPDASAQSGIRENIDVLLQQSFASSALPALDKLSSIAEQIGRVLQATERFQDAIRNLELIPVSGRVEASRFDNAGGFEHIFSEVGAKVSEAKERLSRFVEDLSTNGESAREAGIERVAVRSILARSAELVAAM